MTPLHLPSRAKPPLRYILAPAATAILALLACWVWQPSPAGAQQNTPPAIATPTSTTLAYLFPHGNAAVLDFTGEPVSDADNDDHRPSGSYSRCRTPQPPKT